MRIAMWSGPRNLSTAMMYAFGARADCAVVDEPFYAAYLAATGLQHPMRDEILAAQDTDAKQIVDQLSGSNSSDTAHIYQKHMTQHMLPSVPRDWMRDVQNVFLIRHPARVVASFSAKYDNPILEDIGIAQQAELFELVKAQGGRPVVIDSSAIRQNPASSLKQLCLDIGLDWDPAMLHWPAGGHPADGIWARHWYGAVHKSTGFAGPERRLPELEGSAAALAEKAMPYYKAMKSAEL